MHTYRFYLVQYLHYPRMRRLSKVVVVTNDLLLSENAATMHHLYPGWEVSMCWEER